MDEMSNIFVTSEIGALEGVILHTPGLEVENMTPRNIKRALYSDILNLTVVSQEYKQLQGVLEKVTRTFYIKDLLTEILADKMVKQDLVHRICKNEDKTDIIDDLIALPEKDLAIQLIEGVVMKLDNLTKFLGREYYSLPPLHNFFYTRDSAFVVSDHVFIGRMSGQIRKRETIIMKALYDFHPLFKSKTIFSETETGTPRTVIEGGDALVIQDDILLMGTGARTNSQGVDFVINELNQRKIKKHIIVQELPESPESFIHLDMVFTMLDRDKCMVFDPVVLKSNKYQTVHIEMDNGSVDSIGYEENIVSALKKLGVDLEPVSCGGTKDSWFQEREQWHSGANFFAIGPGRVIGYGRNVHTIEEMNRHGFEVIDARDVLKGSIDLEEFDRYVITIHGSEMSRGGGGCRCMTQPVCRKPVDW